MWYPPLTLSTWEQCGLPSLTTSCQCCNNSKSPKWLEKTLPQVVVRAVNTVVICVIYVFHWFFSITGQLLSCSCQVCWETPQGLVLYEAATWVHGNLLSGSQWSSTRTTNRHQTISAAEHSTTTRLHQTNTWFRRLVKNFFFWCTHNISRHEHNILFETHTISLFYAHTISLNAHTISPFNMHTISLDVQTLTFWQTQAISWTHTHNIVFDKFFHWYPTQNKTQKWQLH